jgi:hypothetical protein
MLNLAHVIFFPVYYSDALLPKETLNDCFAVSLTCIETLNFRLLEPCICQIGQEQHI